MKATPDILHKIKKSQAIQACQILQNAGFEAFFVGGCVRDMLLNIAPTDFDITTSALPDQIMSLFRKHYLTGLQHGTITVSLGQDIINTFEITTFRAEGIYRDGRRPEKVFFVKSLNEDLSRRDFTINSIAFDPISNRFIDPYNGAADIKLGIIRCVGSPNVRFQEDGLRVMRAGRFAARFGFQIEPETFLAMKNNLSTLQKVSKERIKDELCKTINSNRPSYGLMIFKKSGVLDLISSTLRSKGNKIFSPTIDQCFGEIETRLAHLYRQISPSDVKNEMQALKFSNREISKTTFLLEVLSRFEIFLNRPTTSVYKSFVAIIKNHSPDSFGETWRELSILLKSFGIDLKQEAAPFKDEIVFAREELQIDGNDLLKIGIKQGKDFKKILDSCYLEILKFPEHNNREFLTEFVKTMWMGAGYM